MAKRKAAGRAWKLLKLAVVWAKKGGVFRRGLPPGLRLVHSYFGSLRSAAALAVRSDSIGNGEREFSFDETPIFQYLKVHRRPSRSMRLLIHIPCINPPVADDDDVDDDLHDGIFFGRDERERNWLRWDDDDDDDASSSTTTEQGSGSDHTVAGRYPPCGSSGSEISGDQGATAEAAAAAAGADEKSIDMEAEEFIAKFYEQMRLQRQISLLQYDEMLARSTG